MAYLSNFIDTPVLQDQVIASQENGKNLVECRNQILSGVQVEKIPLENDGGLRYKIMPQSDTKLKQTILTEVHNSKFTIHPGSTKMYQDLRRTYW